MTIDTRKAERRRLQFNSIDDLLKEIDCIVEADKAGRLRCTGNWTAGQNFCHLATWIEYCYGGFPRGAHPPLFVRWILRLKKKRYMREGVRPGVKIPGIPNGTYGQEMLSTEEGATRLRAALNRLKHREPVKFQSPAFGPMSDEERILFQLRHAELHLSFLHH